MFCCVLREHIGKKLRLALSAQFAIATRLAAKADDAVADRIKNLGPGEPGTSEAPGSDADADLSGSEPSATMVEGPSLTLEGLGAPFKAHRSLTTPESWHSSAQSAKGSQNLYVK